MGWGESNPIADPNPYLQLLLEAAYHVAKVRLLDIFLDEPEANRSNQAMVAAAEGIDIVDEVGHPTGGGIHAKRRKGADLQ